MLYICNLLHFCNRLQKQYHIMKNYCTDRNSSDCVKAQMAIHDALDVVGGKWKLVLISILRHGKRRFRELSREANISPRILSKELGELEINGLVSRTVCDTKPVTVEYALTPYSETLTEVVLALHKWGIEHRKNVVENKIIVEKH